MPWSSHSEARHWGIVQSGCAQSYLTFTINCCISFVVGETKNFFWMVRGCGGSWVSDLGEKIDALGRHPVLCPYSMYWVFDISVVELSKWWSAYCQYYAVSLVLSADLLGVDDWSEFHILWYKQRCQLDCKRSSTRDYTLARKYVTWRHHVRRISSATASARWWHRVRWWWCWSIIEHYSYVYAYFIRLVSPFKTHCVIPTLCSQ